MALGNIIEKNNKESEPIKKSAVSRVIVIAAVIIGVDVVVVDLLRAVGLIESSLSLVGLLLLLLLVHRHRGSRSRAASGDRMCVCLYARPVTQTHTQVQDSPRSAAAPVRVAFVCECDA